MHFELVLAHLSVLSIRKMIDPHSPTQRKDASISSVRGAVASLKFQMLQSQGTFDVQNLAPIGMVTKTPLLNRCICIVYEIQIYNIYIYMYV